MASHFVRGTVAEHLVISGVSWLSPSLNYNLSYLRVPQTAVLQGRSWALTEVGQPIQDGNRRVQEVSGACCRGQRLGVSGPVTGHHGRRHQSGGAPHRQGAATLRA